jgi:hypothetical protein
VRAALAVLGAVSGRFLAASLAHAFSHVVVLPLELAHQLVDYHSQQMNLPTVFHDDQRQLIAVAMHDGLTDRSAEVAAFAFDLVRFMAVSAPLSA